MKNYERLNEKERNEIVVMLSKGKRVSEIGRKLKRSASSISREIKRNNGAKWYRAHTAQKRAKEKQKESHKKFVLKKYALRKAVEEMLMKGWSPEIIAGRLRKKNPQLPTISHEAIYQWIYSTAPHLIHYLTRNQKEGKHYKRGGNKKRNRIRIANRVCITQRPQEINDRKTDGHWETDLIDGAGKCALKVAVDRKNKLTKIRIVRDKSSSQSNKALLDMFATLPNEFKKSITYDNGSENTGHTTINKKLGTTSYFCQPYHSWEKGTVENTNGLIRRFLPKGSNFDTISKSTISEIESWLNNRPRKCLGYSTPQEVFNSAALH